MIKQKLLELFWDFRDGPRVFAGTRVPVQLLINCLEEKKALSELRIDFSTVRKTQAVIVFGKPKVMRLRKKHAIAA